ncbi:energy transducer TonB [Psittacicella gerlachiana]|uniref:TonB C-terminal domain-containing protein n=1 Tax=Psittacicella gerlachiana TaxID=2028574 RepID=A0A3A1YFS2_9GAMM|nr:energy transducer TonB [Psittacicella gerlachiana]RIY34887.1 hypothetical protein CKF59_04535 [Psittacicella gerlachiana]
MYTQGSNRIGLKLLALVIVILAHVGMIYLLLAANSNKVMLTATSYLDQTSGVTKSSTNIEFFEMTYIPETSPPKEESIAVETNEDKADVNPQEPEKEEKEEQKEEKKEEKPAVEPVKPKPTPPKVNKKPTKPKQQPSQTKVDNPGEKNEAGREAKGTQGSGADAVTTASHQGGYLNNPKPEYPFQSLERGEQGTVILTVVVETNGKPSSVSVKVSSGYPRLDRAAVNTVRRYYTFIPATKGGTPIKSTYEFAIEFSIANR